MLSSVHDERSSADIAPVFETIVSYSASRARVPQPQGLERTCLAGCATEGDAHHPIPSCSGGRTFTASMSSTRWGSARSGSARIVLGCAPPEQMDRWTWAVLAAYTHLRLARGLIADCRLPWERPRPPRQLTPWRVLRGFGHLVAILGTC